jgi:hypothetical protein
MTDDRAGLAPGKLAAQEALQLRGVGIDRHQHTFSLGSLHAVKLHDSSKARPAILRSSLQVLREM